MRVYFFEATRKANVLITDLFDFIWPTVASLWNMRQEIQESKIDEEYLYDKYVSAKEVKRISFRKSFKEQSWDEQIQSFAKITLINIFAIHESWITEVINIVAFDKSDKTKKKLEKGLQFPRDIYKNSGVWVTIEKLRRAESKMISETYYPVLIANKHYSGYELNNLMVLYRFFKECRNAIIHNGGVVGSLLEDSYFELLPLMNRPESFGLFRMPPISEPVLGEKLKMNIDGVVEFGLVVLKIMATCDAELSRCLHAENEFKRMWLDEVGNGKSLKSNPEKRHLQLCRISKKLGFPEPFDTTELITFLREKRIAF